MLKCLMKYTITLKPHIIYRVDQKTQNLCNSKASSSHIHYFYSCCCELIVFFLCLRSCQSQRPRPSSHPFKPRLLQQPLPYLYRSSSVQLSRRVFTNIFPLHPQQLSDIINITDMCGYFICTRHCATLCAPQCQEVSSTILRNRNNYGES